MAITAKELAKLLHLSEAAVSMALNNKPGVSTATRRKVMEMAKKQGYDFTRIQENHAVPPRRNGTIYFIIYQKHGAVVADTPFFSQLTQGIDSGCKKHGYDLSVNYLYDILSNLPFSNTGHGMANHQNHLVETIPEQLSVLLRPECKGIILLGTELQEDSTNPFAKLPVPVVLLDTYFHNTTLDCVLINNVQGAYHATNYLISKCKAQPGYLHSSYSINNFSERANGFYNAVRENGMSTSKCIVHKLSPSLDGAYSDMLELLDRGEETARCYFADNDLIACGAIKAFLEKNYRIPEDIAVIGFDNIPFSSYVRPALTTVNVPKQYMGELAVDRLAERIKNPSACPIKLEVATSLVKRQSV